MMSTGPLGRRRPLLVPIVCALAIGQGSGCADPTGSPTRFESIPATESTFHDAIMAALPQTVSVKGSCKAPYFINCPDSISDPPVLVDVTPAALSLTAAPQTTGSYSQVVTLRVRTRREVAFTLGGAACHLSLVDDATDPHIIAGGTALLVEPTDARPYSWIYLFTEMMTGLEPAMVHITGGAGCDGAFDPHLLSVLVGELLVKQLAICKPEGGSYRLCPAEASSPR